MTAVDLCTFNHGLGIYIRILSSRLSPSFLNWERREEFRVDFSGVTVRVAESLVFYLVYC
jgi:hypothetical protein